MLRWVVYCAFSMAIFNLPVVDATNCDSAKLIADCQMASFVSAGCQWKGNYCACNRQPEDGCSKDTPLTADEKNTRDKMNVKAGMRAGWVPFSFFLFGACMMAGAWSAGNGKADGLLGLAQIFAVITFILCFFLLLNPNWPQAGWLMFCCPFIIVACGLNNQKLLMLTGFVVLFNFMNMLGFWGNVAWIFPTWQTQTANGAGDATLVKTGGNFLDTFAGQSEANCFAYYDWFETVPTSNPWDQQNYSMCAANKFVGFLIWTSMFVIVLQPMILLCQFIALPDADAGKKAGSAAPNNTHAKDVEMS